MHVSIAVIIIIILFVAAHAARTLTVQEAQVSKTGSGHELRQLPRLDPGEEEKIDRWCLKALCLTFGCRYEVWLNSDNYFSPSRIPGYSAIIDFLPQFALIYV